MTQNTAETTAMSYHVQSINYNNFTIRLVDPGIQQSNCSSLPFYSLSRSDFCDTYTNKNNIYDDDNNNNNNNISEQICKCQMMEMGLV
jgi:hypothetical protein